MFLLMVLKSLLPHLYKTKKIETVRQEASAPPARIFHRLPVTLFIINPKLLLCVCCQQTFAAFVVLALLPADIINLRFIHFIQIRLHSCACAASPR